MLKVCLSNRNGIFQSFTQLSVVGSRPGTLIYLGAVWRKNLAKSQTCLTQGGRGCLAPRRFFGDFLKSCLKCSKTCNKHIKIF